jgi:hypothetical protein
MNKGINFCLFKINICRHKSDKCKDSCYGIDILSMKNLRRLYIYFVVRILTVITLAMMPSIADSSRDSSPCHSFDDLPNLSHLR